MTIADTAAAADYGNMTWKNIPFTSVSIVGCYVHRVIDRGPWWRRWWRGKWRRYEGDGVWVPKGWQCITDDGGRLKAVRAVQ